MRRMVPFTPTRAAGLDRLHGFAPAMGRRYAAGRNFDGGPGESLGVSMLSPYVRRRLLLEQELVAAARDQHAEAAEKFVQEVFWRAYFKGFLQQHPAVWDAYRSGLSRDQDRLATESGLRRVYHDATEGRTGIDGFDAWAEQLVGGNWLHNHARMWFASVWIFTLRLPWTLGAAFFLRHLVDGDPASNTLSWRWVAGLHTRGKHYVARADNIARYTGGRFDPRGQLDEAPEPLHEDWTAPRVKLPVADAVPEGEVALLLHAEDCCPESLLADPGRIAAVGVLRPDETDVAAPVAAFATGALEDAVARLAPVAHHAEAEWLDAGQVAAWMARQSRPVVTALPAVGEAERALRGLPVLRLARRWDSLAWPHASRGFFQLKDRVPRILAEL